MESYVGCKILAVKYIEKLSALELRVWEITATIGFYGFVIAKEVSASA